MVFLRVIEEELKLVFCLMVIVPFSKVKLLLLEVVKVLLTVKVLFFKVKEEPEMAIAPPILKVLLEVKLKGELVKLKFEPIEMLEEAKFKVVLLRLKLEPIFNWLAIILAVEEEMVELPPILN